MAMCPPGLRCVHAHQVAGHYGGGPGHHHHQTTARPRPCSGGGSGGHRTALVQQMMQRVAAEPTLPVRRVYDQVVARAGRGDLPYMPPFNAVKTRLERARASEMPPIPHNVEEVVIEGEWAQTWDGEPFLAKQNQRHGFLVFSTDENYIKLSQCTQVRTPSPIKFLSVKSNTPK